jgi:hypothetical protein
MFMREMSIHRIDYSPRKSMLLVSRDRLGIHHQGMPPLCHAVSVTSRARASTSGYARIWADCVYRLPKAVKSTRRVALLRFHHLVTSVL